MTRGIGRPGIWATVRQLLGGSMRMLRHGGIRLIALVALFHLAILVIVLPLIGWIFREALRAGGMVAVDFGNLSLTGNVGITLTLIIVICAIAFWVAAAQFTVITVALRRARFDLPLSTRALLHDLGVVARKLIRPSSLPLIAYLFVLLPLSGFGFTSVLVQGISVPTFISGELMKQPLTAVIWSVLVVALIFVNIKLALTLPIFILTDATGGRALRQSWRITRGRALISLVISVIALFVLASVATSVIVGVSILPTLLTDAIAPEASIATAAFSLGIAQLLGLVLTAIVVAALTAVLVAYLARFKDRLPDDLQLREPAAGTAARVRGRALVSLSIAVCAVLGLGLGLAAIPTMQRLSDYPTTLVFAHRGFSDHGVENTICGLEAAAAIDADLVEMDVMQTKDGKFVAMHDASLSRLAGIDEQVKNLTLDELTEIAVRDLAGNECEIPSFAAYVTRAAELELPLLIEIKLGGADTPDHVELLVEELETLGFLESNIYHSLDAASVETLKHLRPDLSVGYTMPFAGVDLPNTPADFIVVEEWTASEQMQQRATDAGLGFLVWTVNEERSMREHLRRDSDGIITDHPDLTLKLREQMEEDEGLAPVLIDALMRFVVVF